MKNITNDYKTNIKLFGRELDSKITYELNGDVVELGGDTLNSITPHYQSDILKSAMKQLDIDSNVEIPIGTEINYQFGVKVDDEYEYINYGNYIVKEVEKQEDTLSYRITCYDKMLYAMTDYENLNITYPITIRNYLIIICNKLGLTFANASDTFANYDKEIQNELYLDDEGNSLNYTYRDVLDEIAGATASTICINEDDELEVRYINDTNDTINEEYFKDINVKFGQKYGPVNSIVFSRASEADSVYMKDDASILANGLCEIKIKDNQILNSNDRSDYLQDIFDVLDGFEYYINDYSSTGITYYEMCDRYNVSIGNNTYSCIMFNDEVNITQGLEENVNTPMPEKSETDYSKSDKTDRRINQTYIIANKNSGDITALTSRTTSLEDATGNMYTIEQVNALVQDSERGVINTFSQAGGNNLLRNTAPYFMTTDTEAEFWDGAVARITDSDSSNGYGLLLQNGSTKQTVQLKNNYYTLSFKYKMLIPLTTASVKYNGRVINLTEEEDTITTTGLVSEGSLTFEAICDTNNGIEIYELMLNTGEVALEWSQNANEMISDYVQISKGVKVSSSVSNTLTTMESDGFKVKNKSTNETVMEATETGARFKEITAGKGTIAGLLIEKVEDEVWITGV